MLAGTLSRPWQPAAAAVLWGPLPRAMTAAQTRAVRAYGYPPQRVMVIANQPWGNFGSEATRSWSPGLTPLTVDRFGNFSLRRSTGTDEGIEIVVVLATTGSSTELVPVAAAATVVTSSGTLPPELEFWRSLAAPLPQEKGGRV